MWQLPFIPMNFSSVLTERVKNVYEIVNLLGKNLPCWWQNWGLYIKTTSLNQTAPVVIREPGGGPPSPWSICLWGTGATVHRRWTMGLALFLCPQSLWGRPHMGALPEKVARHPETQPLIGCLVRFHRRLEYMVHLLMSECKKTRY